MSRFVRVTIKKKTRKTTRASVNSVVIPYAALKSYKALLEAAIETQKLGRAMTKKEYVLYVKDIEAELFALIRAMCVEMEASFESFKKNVHKLSNARTSTKRAS